MNFQTLGLILLSRSSDGCLLCSGLHAGGSGLEFSAAFGAPDEAAAAEGGGAAGGGSGGASLSCEVSSKFSSSNSGDVCVCKG